MYLCVWILFFVGLIVSWGLFFYGCWILFVCLQRNLRGKEQNKREKRREFKGWDICPIINIGRIRARRHSTGEPIGDPRAPTSSGVPQELTARAAGPPLLRRTIYPPSAGIIVLGFVIWNLFLFLFKFRGVFGKLFYFMMFCGV